MKAKNVIVIFLPTLLMIAAACETGDPNPAFELTKQSGTIQTIAGKGPDNSGHEGDGGIATEATIGWVTGVALDAAGNVYISDGAANTIRKITISDGKINTVAGAFRGYNIADLTPDAGDGGEATQAHLNFPASITLIDEDLFFTDVANSKVRKVEGTTISTYAGSKLSGFEGDGGLATSAKLWAPQGVVADSEGNLFFSDTQNHVVRKVELNSGKISTVVGMGPDKPGYLGDGGSATIAKLYMPRDLAIDQSGNLFIADTGNNVVRKVSNGIITTIAGTGLQGYTGDGGTALSASLSNNQGVAIDNQGILYVADTGNNVIRRVDTDGIITTYAGNGTYGYSGDGGPATSAQLKDPMDVAVDAEGNLYIADTNNSAIRFVAK
jgi:sugar lactone lactonase YvrE